MIQYYRYKEPIKNKLKRWIFKEKNLISTVTEQKIIDIQLSETTKAILSEFFLKNDPKFRFGINRKLLIKTYKALGMFKNKEEKENFLQASNYFKKRNQKIAGVHLREFLMVFKQMYEKSHKINPNLTEAEFLSRVIQELELNIPYLHKWEAEIDSKRKEFKKSLPQLEDRKRELIKLRLSNEPLLDLEKLDVDLKANGLLGLSLREKIEVIRSQMGLLVAKSRHLSGKINSGENEGKRGKRSLKLKELDDRIGDYRGRLETLRAEYKSLYREETNI